MQLRRFALPICFLATAACYPGMLGTPDGGTLIVVAIAPPSATLQTGASLRFQGAVYGTSDLAVTWSVQETAAGGTMATHRSHLPPATAGAQHCAAPTHERAQAAT